MKFEWNLKCNTNSLFKNSLFTAMRMSVRWHDIRLSVLTRNIIKISLSLTSIWGSLFRLKSKSSHYKEGIILVWHVPELFVLGEASKTKEKTPYIASKNSKIKNVRCGFDGQLFPRVAKNKRTHLWRSSFFLNYRNGHTLKVRQSRDTLNKHYLEHFEKLARGVESPPPWGIGLNAP